MIRVFRSENQDGKFYEIMGRHFASLDIAKELERQIYNKPNTTWYVSSLRNTVVGFCSVFDAGKNYFIDNLYVFPDFRKMGTAKEIISDIIDDFTDKPIKCIACNPYALKIFSECGFIYGGKNGKYTKLSKH